jgi:hypothetical protein
MRTVVTANCKGILLRLKDKRIDLICIELLFTPDHQDIATPQLVLLSITPGLVIIITNPILLMPASHTP